MIEEVGWETTSAPDLEERALEHRPRRGARRVLFDLGVCLLVLGLGVVAFWVYLLWGTAVSQHAAQARLSEDLTRKYAAPTTTVPAKPPSTTATTIPPPGPATPFVWPALANGDPVARIVIPKIGLNMVVVEGTDTADLREGPGHYPGTPLPGQAGNVAIAAHRTTYAHPFYNLNELSSGDSIMLTVPGHQWQYVVTGQMVVAPSDVAVAEPLAQAGSWLTLTTCNPRYSAATRLVVRAQLASASTPAAPETVVTPAAATPAKGGGVEVPTAPVSAPSSGTGSWGAVAGWGVLLAGIGAVVAALWRWRRQWPWRLGAGLVGGLAGLFCLWGLFGALATLLPAGY